MKGFILTNYAVKGIKNISEWARIGFYKNSNYSKPITTKGYNVKGIYGENGAGKSGLITSVRILRELIIDPNYINNFFVQNELHELVNKKLECLEYELEFLAEMDKKIHAYIFKLCIGKDMSGRYIIKSETLSLRNALAHEKKIDSVYMVKNGDIIDLNIDELIAAEIREKTKNLLSGATLVSVYCNTVLLDKKNKDDQKICIHFIVLFILAFSLYVYLDEEDEHTDYYIKSAFDGKDDSDTTDFIKKIMESTKYISGGKSDALQPKTMMISKSEFASFEKQVNELKGFLQIFKSQLKDIKIDKSPDKEFFRCKLIMYYDDYSVDAEFESTGIKKLIKLFVYLKKMVEGEIVFIDELDSNLHDVYLCALLEYLMQYGKGQLCFTSHNIGPMDILKKGKKSIDFLSVDKCIYSWSKNGNYSPSKLYKEGMISGSPFNVDSIDFLGILDGSKEE